MESKALAQMVATLLSPAEVTEKIAQSILSNCTCPRTVYIKGKAQ